MSKKRKRRKYSTFSKSSSTGNGTATTTDKATSWFARCNHKPTEVCKIGSVRLYGATKGELNSDTLKGYDLLVNCTFSRVAKVDYAFPQAFDSLRKHYGPMIDEIVLDWTDGSDYPTKLEFWKELFDLCVANRKKKVVFTCLGGHGRTGTAIASMIVAATSYGAKKAIDTVRKVMCRECIETYTQERYLYDLEFEKTGVQPERIYSSFKSDELTHFGSGFGSSSYQSQSQNSSKGWIGNYCGTCEHIKAIHCSAKTGEEGSCVAHNCTCNLFVPETAVKVQSGSVSSGYGSDQCVCLHSAINHSTTGKRQCLISACDCDYFISESLLAAGANPSA